MRLGFFALLAMLLFVLVAGQSIVSRSADAESSPSAVTSCAVSEDECSSPWSSNSSDVVVEHAIYVGGCTGADLHVVRYVPAESASGEPMVAIWCADR